VGGSASEEGIGLELEAVLQKQPVTAIQIIEDLLRLGLHTLMQATQYRQAAKHRCPHWPTRNEPMMPSNLIHTNLSSVSRQEPPLRRP
jgi:hypothetical protein